MRGVKVVYLVSSGRWSDYTVHCAFTTKELAQAYIDSHPAQYDPFNEVERLQLWNVNPTVRQEKRAIEEMDAERLSAQRS